MDYSKQKNILTAEVLPYTASLMETASWIQPQDSQSSNGITYSREKLNEILGSKCHFLVSLPSNSSVINYWKPYTKTKNYRVDPQIRANHLIRSMINEVDDYLRRVDELMIVFGLESMNDKESIAEWSKYYLIALQGKLIQQFKYSVNLAFCKHFTLEEPKFEEGFLGMHLFPRRLKVKIQQMGSRKLKKLFNIKNLTLINSLFQGFKKGLLPCRPDITDANLNKHCKALSSDGSIPEYMEDRIREIYKRSFGDLKLRDEIDFDIGISRSATREYNYEAAGNLGALLDNYFGKKKGFRIITDEFIGFAEAGPGKYSDPISLYSPYPTRRELLFWGYTEDGVWLRGSEPWAQVTPNCILEPMKVRIITKPNALCYLGMNDIQSQLWSYLYQHKSGAFRLIGETITVEHLAGIAREWQTGFKFVSGDYSAATDNLKRRVSEIILEEIFESVSFKNSPSMAQRVVDSMTHCIVDYSEGKSHPRDPSWPYEYSYPDNGKIFQTNGQLMGHVVSFPILCMANYIAYHLSLERYVGRRVRPFSRKVLINGDDILFCTSPGHYEVWKDTVSDFGFVPSVGKNFYSDKIMQINSRLYYVHTIDEFVRSYVTGLTEIPFVNFGLLTNRKKQDCSRDLTVQRIYRAQLEDTGFDDPLMDRASQISKIFSALVRDIPESVRMNVLKVWKMHTREYVNAFLVLPIPGWSYEEICPKDPDLKMAFDALSCHPNPFSVIFKLKLERKYALARQLCPNFDGHRLWTGEPSVIGNITSVLKEVFSQFNGIPYGPVYVEEPVESKVFNRLV